ncbi:hypothetical protein PAQ31011_00156 [Pandoraea aquatica]|uniref:Protein BatD n=1 Tax=Pandoraea aquatica TaxID=2508290 RepID=A0A5E4RK39_9BURK|nr:hypothetical protein [Pandoraea aquatica]VVD62238.1 hypothetical protein PAQ31011_00156 [Pandoraea aquatica]
MTKIMQQVVRCLMVRIASLAIGPWLCATCLAVTAIIAPGAHADEPPKTMIRAHLEPAGNVVAGTQVKLVVDILTTTWLSDAPDWPLFDMPGAIVTLPDEQARNLSETIGDERWFGVSRAYRIAPQAGQRYTVPSFVIHVLPGGATGPVALHTPSLSFVATVPPGAEGMAVFFPTSGLNVSQKIEPSPSHLQVGDTVTRTITQRATATEAILIPPAPLVDVDGLQRYMRPAQTSDDLQGSRGLVAGVRTDSAMYVVNRSGHIELPAVEIEWWNTAAHRREHVSLPAISLSARGAHETPLFEIPVDAVGRAAHRVIVLNRSDLWIAGAGLAFVFALVWVGPRLLSAARGSRQRIATWRRTMTTGEPHAWRQLKRAARGTSWSAFVGALYAWLDRRADAPGGLTMEGSQDMVALRGAVYARYALGAPHDGPVDPQLAQRLKVVRKQMIRASRRSSASDDLPPLYAPVPPHRPSRRSPN